MKVRSPRSATPGVISADEAYTLNEFRRRAGMGEHALREARKAGLPVRELGRKRYILGSDFLEFLREQDSQQEES